MGRCSSCNGVVTKDDSAVCYVCGDPLPKRARVSTAKPVSGFSTVLLMASVGMTAFSLLSSYKLPITVTLAISACFFVMSMADRYRGFMPAVRSDGKSAERPSKSVEQFVSRVRLQAPPVDQ